MIETVAAKGLGALLGARTLEIKNDLESNAIAAAVEMARDRCKVIVATTDANVYPAQIKLLTELLARNPNIIIVSVRTPYDTDILPAVPTVLAAYGGNLPTLQAIMDVLLGKSKASGVLPVALQ